MLTEEGNSPIGGMSEEPSVERDMDMAEAGESRGVAVERAGKTTHMSFVVPCEHWEGNNNGMRQRNDTLEPVGGPGVWMRRRERTVREQECEVTQLHETIDRMARMLQAHMMRKEAQLRGMKEWLADRETKWDDLHRDNVQWGAAIAHMSAMVLAIARAGGAAPTQEARQEDRDKTAKQDSEGLGASQHEEAVQGGEPEQRQLQQQQKHKPRLLLKQQSEQRHKPKSKATPTQARRWDTVQPGTQSQRAPTGPSPATTYGSSMAERRLFSRTEEGVPRPNRMDQKIALAINRALFHQKAPVNIWLMNVKRNAKGAITTITHQKATAAIGTDIP